MIAKPSMDTCSIQKNISSITYKAKLRLMICNDAILERASLKTIRPPFPKGTALFLSNKIRKINLTLPVQS